MLDFLFTDVVLKTLKYDRSDLTILGDTNDVWLFGVHFNDVFCGLICLTTKTEKEFEIQYNLLTHKIVHSELDFFILMNDLDAMIVMTDHNKTILPQHIQLKKRGMLELVCGKPFMKNLIANRGIEYYD